MAGSAAVVAILGIAAGAGSRAPGQIVLVHGALFVASLGVGICQAELAHPPALLASASTADRMIVEGTVASRPQLRATPWGSVECSATVSADRVWTGGEFAEYPRTLIAVVNVPCDVVPGHTLRVEGRPMETETRQDVALCLIPINTEVSGRGRVSERGVARIDENMAGLLAETPDHAQGLIPGVALGDDSRVSPELAAAMKLTGLTHLIAVSGGHISIIIAITVAVVGRRFNAVTAALCALALVGLVLLVGPHPSVIRAVGMSVVLLGAMAVGRGTGAVPALCIAIVVTCLAFPRIAMGYGFWLSAAATAGIVIVGTPLAELLASGMPRGLAEAIAIPLAAQLSCVPILMLFSDEGSVWAVAANAAVAPVIAPLTVSGLIVALAAPLPVASIALIPATMSTWWIDLVAKAFADAPGSGIPLVWAGAACLAMLGGLLVFRGVALIIVAAGLGCWWLWLLLAGRPPTVAEDWTVIQCDVGQGSALIARSQGGPTIMMDVGPEGPAAAQCLASAGVSHLDLLILSHAHSDHIGGLPEVLAEASVAEVWLSPNPDPIDNTEWLESVLYSRDVPFRAVQAGEEFPSATNPFVEILWPMSPNQREGEANAQSLAAYIDVAGGILVLSDLPAESQERLAPYIEPVGTVIMAHHGSADQSHQLAANASPALTLISVGENSYGHPASAALELYADSQIFDTLTCGRIVMNAQGRIESQCDETP